MYWIVADSKYNHMFRTSLPTQVAVKDSLRMTCGATARRLQEARSIRKEKCGATCLTFTKILWHLQEQRPSAHDRVVVNTDKTLDDPVLSTRSSESSAPLKVLITRDISLLELVVRLGCGRNVGAERKWRRLNKRQEVAGKLMTSRLALTFHRVASTAGPRQ